MGQSMDVSSKMVMALETKNKERPRKKELQGDAILQSRNFCFRLLTGLSLLYSSVLLVMNLLHSMLRRT